MNMSMLDRFPIFFLLKKSLKLYDWMVDEKFHFHQGDCNKHAREMSDIHVMVLGICT